jgi:RNA polymerase sigma factor (TIGR02999 family)
LAELAIAQLATVLYDWQVARVLHAPVFEPLMSEVTRILSAIEQGDPNAADMLLPLVYGELRSLASQRLADEKAGHSLQATALVNEAYIRLFDVKEAQHWNSRAHFFSAAAEAMRRIMVDQARRRKAAKRGGQAHRQDLNESTIVAPDHGVDVIALNDVLDLLAATDPAAANLVKLRFFAGFNMSEAAEALGISERSAYGTWAYARSWLRQKMMG